MPEAISNTSPLLYLHRIESLGWLPELFEEIWIPNAVAIELQAGRQKGYNVPAVSDYSWLRIIEPNAIPSEWLVLDLGAGELAAMALALENPAKIVLLDDALARRVAKAAGLQVWGTLKILLEAKSQGLIPTIKPSLDRLGKVGMWLSEKIRQQVLVLAGEE